MSDDRPNGCDCVYCRATSLAANIQREIEALRGDDLLCPVCQILLTATEVRLAGLDRMLALTHAAADPNAVAQCEAALDVLVTLTSIDMETFCELVNTTHSMLLLAQRPVSVDEPTIH